MSGTGKSAATSPRVKRRAKALEMDTVTDDFADEDIVCSCPGGNARPPNGHTLLRCTDCDRWYHHNCLAGDSQISAAMLRNGYTCEPCRVRARKQSARKGAATKRKLGIFSPRNTNPTARKPTAPVSKYGANIIPKDTSRKPTAPASRYGANIIPNANTLRPSNLRNGLTAQDVNGDAPTQMRFQLSMAASPMGQDQSDDDDDDDDDNDDDRAGGTTTFARLLEDVTKPKDRPRDSTAMGNSRDGGELKRPLSDPPSPAQQRMQERYKTGGSTGRAIDGLRQIERYKTTDQLEEQDGMLPGLPSAHALHASGLRSSRKPRSESDDEDDIDELLVSCACGTKLDDDMSRYITCTYCECLQHKACKPPSDISTQKNTAGAMVPICINCKYYKARNKLLAMAATIKKAKGLLAKAEDKQERADTLRANAMNNIFLTHMWRHYCSLPAGQASPALQNLTRMQYHQGRMEPVHAIPERWAKAVRTSIEKLQQQASNIITHVVGNDPASLSMRDPDRVLRTLREVATLAMYSDAYKGRREAFGILGELLGLVEKGTVWKE